MSTGKRRGLPIYDATAPIVCSLDEGQREERLALIARLRDELEQVDRTEHGMLLRFPSDRDLDAEIQHFAQVEKACCGFWGFDVQRAGSRTTLRWDAPPAADDLVELLLAWLRGDDGADITTLL